MIEPGPYADLVRALVKRRQQLRLSQAELDVILGVADRLVSKWEAGTRRPGAFMIVCWADALGMAWKPKACMSVSAARRRVAKRARGEGAVAA